MRGLYFFFRLTTGLRVTSLPEHGAILSSLGYRIENERRALGGLVVSELWIRPPELSESGFQSRDHRESVSAEHGSDKPHLVA